MTRAILLILLFGLVLAAGCTDDFTRGFRSKVPDQNVDINANAVPDVPPIPPNTINPFLFQPDKTVYYICDDNGPVQIDGNGSILAQNGYALCMQGLSRFIAFSKVGVRCEFVALNNDDIVQQLVDLKGKGVDVKLVLKTDYAVKDCLTGCVPADDSSFKALYNTNVLVQYSPDVHENFCVNDRGLFYGTFIPDRAINKEPASAFVIYADQIKAPFNDRFFKVFRN